MLQVLGMESQLQNKSSSSQSNSRHCHRMCIAQGKKAVTRNRPTRLLGRNLPNLVWPVLTQQTTLATSAITNEANQPRSSSVRQSCSHLSKLNNARKAHPKNRPLQAQMTCVKEVLVSKRKRRRDAAAQTDQFRIASQELVANGSTTYL